MPIRPSLAGTKCPPRPYNLYMSGKKPSLGRGLAELSPLLARRAVAGDSPASEPPPALPGDRMASLPLDLLQRGKYQPRIDMRTESLTELAESIKAQGLV